MTTKEVDIPEFLKDKNKDSNWITVKETEFHKLFELHDFKVKMAFMNGLAIGALSVAILFTVIASCVHVIPMLRPLMS